MADADLLEEAYNMGLAHAEDDVKDYGEKRWLDSPYLSWMNEEEMDSYWAGYEDYTEDLIDDTRRVEIIDTEVLPNGQVIVTGTVPKDMMYMFDKNSLKGVSLNGAYFDGNTMGKATS